MLNECWIIALGFPIEWVWLFEKFQIKESQGSFYTPLEHWGNPNPDKKKGCPPSLENMNTNFLLNVNIYYNMIFNDCVMFCYMDITYFNDQPLIFDSLGFFSISSIFVVHLCGYPCIHIFCTVLNITLGYIHSNEIAVLSCMPLFEYFPYYYLKIWLPKYLCF